MCMICDGYSYEDADRWLDLTIRVHGFAMQQVEGDEKVDPWTYTIGLAESFGRPDLILLDGEPARQGRLLKAIVEDSRARGTFDEAALAAEDIELVPVHPTHTAGNLVATWANRYQRTPRQGEFLQVVLGKSYFCECCYPKVRRLDRPKRRRRRDG